METIFVLVSVIIAMIVLNYAILYVVAREYLNASKVEAIIAAISGVTLILIIAGVASSISVVIVT